MKTHLSRYAFYLAMVILLAFVLRIGGVFSGLPNPSHHWSYHPDEWAIPRVAQTILATGDFHPHTFVYGTLTVYLTYAFYRPLFYYWTQPQGLDFFFADVYVISRLITLLFSLATLLVVFILGKKLYDARVGVVSALFIALSPGLIVHSQYGTVDVPLTFFVTLALYAAIRLTETGSWSWLMGGAACVGLAMGCKAQGLLAIAPIWAAIGLSPAIHSRSKKWGLSLATLVITLCFFFLTCPYVLLDYAGYLAAQKDNVSQVIIKGDHAGLWVGIHPWTHHVTHNLPYVLGIPLTLASLAGVCYLFVRRHRFDWILIAWLIPFTLMLTLTASKFMRYVFPLTPVLMLVGVNLLTRLPAYLGKSTLSIHLIRRLLIGVCLLSLLVPAALQMMAQCNPDPRDQAARWIRARTSPQDRIGLLHVPWFYTPPLSPFNFGDATRPRFVASQTNGTAEFQLPLIQSWNKELLLSEKPEYLVASEFEWREEERLRAPKALDFMAVLDREYQLVQRLNTFPPAWRWVFGQTFAPHDWLYAFPEVRIYQRREPLANSSPKQAD